MIQTTPTKLPLRLALACVLAALLIAAALLAWLAWQFTQIPPPLALALRLIIFSSLAAAPAMGVLYLFNLARWRAFAARHAIEQTRAQVQIAPLAQSFHLHNEPHVISPEPTVPPALLPAPALDLDPSRPMLAQMDQRGHIARSGRSLLVGYAGATPQYIEMLDCGFIGVGGQPRVGKTSLVLLLLAQAARMGWHLAVADPHVHKADGLMQRCAPISGAAIRLAATPDEIAEMVRLVDKIGRRRVNGDADRTPVMLVIDEFSNLVIRKLLPDDVLAILPSMAMEYAGVGVHGIIIGHDWNARLLGGDLGAALRRAITHRLVCRSDMQNAEFLLPNGTLARQAAGLQKGQALYWGTDAPAIVDVPLLGIDDLEYAGDGRPRQIYTPRSMPRPAPVELRTTAAPPTAAAPTGALPLTIPMLIVDLLAARHDWLTASEIAKTLTLDVQVVRTELTPLVSGGQVARRPARKRGRDQYEYGRSTESTINALNMTVSA